MLQHTGTANTGTLEKQILEILNPLVEERLEPLVRDVLQQPQLVQHSAKYNATCCNTLQHAAIRCRIRNCYITFQNTLQHVATRCNML